MAIAEAGGAGTTRVGRARRTLDALNFFLADVRGGLGPYLAVYLLTVRNWNEAEIRIIMSISAIAGILAETPCGALIDAAESAAVKTNSTSSLHIERNTAGGRTSHGDF